MRFGLVGEGVSPGVDFDLSKDSHHLQCLSFCITAVDQDVSSQLLLCSAVIDSNSLRL